MSSDAFKRALGESIGAKAIPAFIEPFLTKYGITPDTIREYAERIARAIESVDSRLNGIQMAMTLVHTQNEEILRLLHQSQSNIIPAGETPVEALVHAAMNYTGEPNGELR